jgi:hypothetical protein
MRPSDYGTCNQNLVYKNFLVIGKNMMKPFTVFTFILVLLLEAVRLVGVFMEEVRGWQQVVPTLVQSCIRANKGISKTNKICMFKRF